LTFENKKMCKGTTTIPDFEKSESPFGIPFVERREPVSGMAGGHSKGLKMKKAVPTLKSWDEPFF